ncbi:MAG: hypothetical protein SFU99_08100 [Saprospiraceae bacterium]|nr:hypothetical protein [Saprospiraceae bacterium]
MKNREDVNKELQALSPLLAKLKEKQTPLEVPENYFHALPDQIWEQIKLMPQPERTKPQLGWWERLMNGASVLLRPRIAIGVATFAILVIAGIFMLKPGSDSENPFSGLSGEEVTAYMSENIHEFDTELLIKAASVYQDWSLMSGSEFNEEEVDQLLKEVLKDLDDEILEELL